MILGTAAYMAPEQARGATVDKRADVWAFGVVLWEMLTGRRPFEGATVSDTLAAVLTRDPDWTTLPADAPSRDAAVPAPLPGEGSQAAAGGCGGCAAGDRRGAGRRRRVDDHDVDPRHRRHADGWHGWSIAAVLLAVAALAIPTVQYLRETAPPAPPETRLDIVTPATDHPASFALSPDGRQIVFVASGDGPLALWLRSLATTTAQPLAGTEGRARIPSGRPMAAPSASSPTVR